MVTFTPVERPPRRPAFRPITDVEFLATLRTEESFDSVAELGTKVASEFNFLENAPNVGIALSAGTQEGVDSLGLNLGESVPPMSVNTGADRSVPAVQGHEFRHAAEFYIIDRFSREDMVERWGDEAGTLRDILNYRNEGATEVFDHPEENAGFDKGQQETMAGTIQEIGGLTTQQVELVDRLLPAIAEDIMRDDLKIPRANTK